MRPFPPQWPSGISVGKTQTRPSSRGRAPSSASSTASVTSATTAARALVELALGDAGDDLVPGERGGRTGDVDVYRSMQERPGDGTDGRVGRIERFPAQQNLGQRPSSARSASARIAPSGM